MGRAVHARVGSVVEVHDVAAEGQAMSPVETLVRQLRALRLDVELSRLDGASVRAAVHVRLTDMLERYESDCADVARGDDSDRAQRERMSVEW